jgi:hypothetical protein
MLYTFFRLYFVAREIKNALYILDWNPVCEEAIWETAT